MKFKKEAISTKVSAAGSARRGLAMYGKISGKARERVGVTVGVKVGVGAMNEALTDTEWV